MPIDWNPRSFDLDDETQLKIAIPVYAKKLKEIALYYQVKREEIKRLKLKYNTIGSLTGLERSLYEKLLSAFTKKPNNISLPNTPALSSVSNSFHIEIQELYDMHDYYDDTTIIDANTSVNPLFFILEDYIANNYSSSIPLSAFSNAYTQLTSSNAGCAIDDTLNVEILAQLNEKYLGTDIYYLTGGYFTNPVQIIIKEFTEGSNMFYWFSGDIVQQIPEGIYSDVAITDIDWTAATSGSSYDIADIIFTKLGTAEINGAWLAESYTTTVSDTMSATMRDGKTMRFGFPGQGKINDNNIWTGLSISDKTNTDQLFTNQGDTDLINVNYFSSTLSSISAVQSILLQNTELIDDGAYANKNYKFADKLEKSDEYAFAYKLEHTQLPITNGDNTIYYPLTTYGSISDLFFRFEKGGTAVLSSLNVWRAFAGAKAGNDLTDSDIIYKIDGVCGTTEEAAYLKSPPLSGDVNQQLCNCEDNSFVDYYTKWFIHEGNQQPSLTFTANAGEYIKFIWCGKRTKLNDLKFFRGFEHDQSCEYLKSAHKSLVNHNYFDSDSPFDDWKACTCGAVYHTPLGHNGQTLNAYNIIPDIIYLDTQFPEQFNKATWVGTDNADYSSSKDICYFQNDSGLGWSSGQWKASDNSEFYFEKGKTYVYYRSNLGRCEELPFIHINQPLIDFTGYWAKAVKQLDGTWLASNDVSDMQISAGQFLKYVHPITDNYSAKRLQYQGSFVNNLTSDYISLSASDTSITYVVSEFDRRTSNFLIKIPLDNAAYWAEYGYYDGQRLFREGYNNQRIENTYLQISQAYPSRMIAADKDILEYYYFQIYNNLYFV